MRTLKARGGDREPFFPIQAKLRGGNGGIVPLLLFQGLSPAKVTAELIFRGGKKIHSTGRLGVKCESMATAPLRESRRRKV